MKIAGPAGLLGGWLASTTIWALGLGIAFASLNDSPAADLPALFIVFAPSYLAIGLPALFATALLGTALRVFQSGWRACFVAGAAACGSFLLCLNLVCRWTPAYKAFSPTRTGPVLVPIGVADLAAIAVVLIVQVFAILWLARPAVGRRRAFLAIAATLVAVVGMHAVNRAYERPRRVDLASRLASTIRPDPSCKPTPEPVKGLVLLALDGMTWNVAVPLLEQGKMPRLERLLSRSAYGYLDTLPTSYSPVVWATIATGLPESEHRIHGFIQYNLPGASTPLARGPQLNSFIWWGGSNRLLSALTRLGVAGAEPLASSRRPVHALWDVAAAHDYTVGIFDWMNTWPVAQVPGYMLSHYVHPPGNAFPAETFEFVKGLPPSRPRFPQHAAVEGLKMYEHAMALYERFRPRVSMHFNKVMDVSHDTWAGANGPLARSLPFPPREFQPDIESAYRLSDEWIGRFLDEAPDDYGFVIVSDHGYDFDGTHHVYAPPGVVILSGGPFACGRLIDGADVYDVAPTLLALLGLPATTAMPGHPLEAAMGVPGPPPVRVDQYPPEWRLPEVGGAETDRDNWDDVRARLRAMGYVN